MPIEYVLAILFIGNLIAPAVTLLFVFRWLRVLRIGIVYSVVQLSNKVEQMEAEQREQQKKRNKKWIK